MDYKITTEQMFNGIEFIPVKKSAKGARATLAKNNVGIRRIATDTCNNFIVRFSLERSNELKVYQSVKIAKNQLTGDIYLVFFKDEQGTPLSIDYVNHQLEYSYVVVRNKNFVDTFLSSLKVPDGNCVVILETSDNLSNKEDFYTLLITGKRIL